MLTSKIKNLILFTLINLFSLFYNKEINILLELKHSLRENQAVNILNQAILAGQSLNNTASLELMNKRKWIEASRLIIDFLTDFNDQNQINVIKKNNEEYLSYLKNMKSILKDKKKNAVHCKYCGVCVLGYDHHCAFTSKCIGKRTIITFYFFLVFSLVSMMSTVFSSIIVLQNIHSKKFNQYYK